VANALHRFLDRLRHLLRTFTISLKQVKCYPLR
jgi:hypothetical protein